MSLPAVTVPTLTLPTKPGPTSPSSPTSPGSPAETVTTTTTATATATATSTETATVTQTETQTVTATPTPESALTSPPAPTSPSDDGGTTWWPWLLLALVAIGALAWLLLRRRRAQAEIQAWDERLAEAEREASWIEDSLTSQVISGSSSAEAQTIWTAAQPRLLEADATFHTLSTTAPDAARAERATDVRGLLRGLVEAVGADLAAPPGAGPDQFRARRAVVDSARRELRATLGPVDRPGPGAAGGSEAPTAER
ncbi:hypothetical protein GCM10009868_40020 [Terrabacter aerolatus]|uniref:Uncharacterized protein n=1 Tax=Terrabacter aerolatus TaxID=422442 RepID=A0A512D078_9MICO|nr:hypothetical protein TAE01_16750 [Terrabacter aerolatus]